MKKNLLMLLVIISYSGYGQLVYDKRGEVIPFSQTEKYRDIILTDQSVSLVLPSFNNDSLFKAGNKGKSPNEVGSSFAAGLRIDTNIDIRKSGKQFDIEEGKIWIFTILSKTAKSISPVIERFEIPAGAYLSFRTFDNDEKPYTLTNENVESEFRKSSDFTSPLREKQIVIEYFEPSHIASDFPIILKVVVHYYFTVFKEPSKLKDGTYGEESLLCQRKS